MIQDLTEQEVIRREKLDEIRKLGIDPYPAEEYPVNAYAIDLKEQYEAEKPGFENIVLAGRLMSVRDMGKACFAELKDNSGRIQIYVRRDDICPGEDKTLYDQLFKKLLDIGDFIGVKGFMFKTKMGETTLHVKELTLLC
ncbi:MAG TPA: OB-fold nucleic acid binding domain-containing protein, partial [Flavobacteriales bacterium]|nr:OB-fold nucleic acid binding domain-containing protein [Flavobacteriales bacterium]